MTEKEILWDKIKLMYRALSKPDRWYTGQSIKKYLRTKVFQQGSQDYRNIPIQSGRWSAYCHYSLLKSFQNLLDKHNLKPESKVLVHPLVPAELLDELQKRNLQIDFVDINKHTLAFDSQTFTDSVKRNNNIPSYDLVINYTFNGLYEFVTEQVKLCQQQSIPVLCIVDNASINRSVLELFQQIELGSVLWMMGESFLDKELEYVISEPLETAPWYSSWFIETRTKSILEYHLKDSYKNFIPLIECYTYLLIKKYQKHSFVAKLWLFPLKRYLFRTEIQNKDKAQTILEDSYNQIFDAAVPDVFFDLIMQPSSVGVPNNVPTVEAVDTQPRAHEIYSTLVEEVATRPAGTLEIPDLYLDKTYLSYFFYTTEEVYWLERLQSKYPRISRLDKIHPSLQAREMVSTAQFVNQYILIIDLV